MDEKKSSITVSVKDASKAQVILHDHRFISFEFDGSNSFIFSDWCDYAEADSAFYDSLIEIISTVEPEDEDDYCDCFAGDCPQEGM